MGPLTDWLMCRPPGLDPCSATDPVVDTNGSEMSPSGLKRLPSRARRGCSDEGKKTAWHLNPPNSPFGNAEARRTQSQNAHRLFLCSAISATLRFRYTSVESNKASQVPYL